MWVMDTTWPIIDMLAQQTYKKDNIAERDSKLNSYRIIYYINPHEDVFCTICM